MIQDTDRFICPVDLQQLEWRDATCGICGRSFNRGSFQNLGNEAEQFDLYDFRENSP
jgi:hypothetical protein